MENTRQVAMFCVGRAVMFSALAISLVMLSFAFDPAAALKAGGILALMLASVLIWFAQTAARRQPKDTETWLLLAKEHRPKSDHACRVFVNVMEEVYLFFAARVFAIAAMLLAAGVVLSLLGVKSSWE